MIAVTVVDYGVGNLLSVTRALEHCGASPTVESSPLLVGNAQRLVLPGVGAFGDGMAELERRGLAQAVRDYAAGGRPLLGICLGMQLLFDGSDEFGAKEGLGLISGWVKQVPLQPGIKLPHIGWSPIRPADGRKWAGTVLDAVPAGSDVYFLHSFHGEPSDPGRCLAQTPYGDSPFCSVVQQRNIVGCQFHPEKSGRIGLGILQRFLQCA